MAAVRTLLLLLLVGPSARTAGAQDGYCMENGTTTGGAGGSTVTVTTADEFIAQATATGARIIQVQGVLTIGAVALKSDKTIVGLGTDATLLGRLRISGISNVIIRNLRISNPGEDGISIRDANTHHVWVDHVTFFDCGDGACDISQGADYVTVSWCKFIYPTQQEHKFTMIADGPKDGGPLTAHITLHHNWWSTGSDQRMAASSDALVHYYNNYFSCAGNSYCSNARDDTEINSENNYYQGVKDPVTTSSGTSGKIRTSGNLYPGCTGTIDSGTDTVFTPPYVYVLDNTVDVPALVQAGAGAPGPDTVPIPPKVWDGGGANDSLGTALNWRGNEAPREYDSLAFAGSIRLSPINSFSGGTEFPSIIFSNSAGAFTLGGSTLNLGTGIRSDSSAVQTIDLNLDFTYASDHFAMDREFNVTAADGSLVINGSISGYANSYGKSYTVSKRGPGLLALGGINSFPGTFRFLGGLVRFSDAANLGTTALVFDGGGLQWAAGSAVDISGTPVPIQAGGATFDVGANQVSFANPVGSGGAGGLVKAGTGTLTLNGNNTYHGPTRVENGTLALGTSGAIPNSPQINLESNGVLNVYGRSDAMLTLTSGQVLTGNGAVWGDVSVGSGATVSPGASLGTLYMDHLALLTGSTCVMELDRSSGGTSDRISLTYEGTPLWAVTFGGNLVVENTGPALAAGDSFRLFEATAYNGAFDSITLPPLEGDLVWTNTLSVDGMLAVISPSGPPVNTTPTNMVYALDGTNLTLSWPEDHTGWWLEAQTNGLGTNWFAVPGSAETNLIVFPLFPEVDSAFFRLRYP